MDALPSAGGFRFLPSDGPFSNGVAADRGFAIVRVYAPHNTPLANGFRLVEQVLQGSGRPLAALCAMELRVPQPFTRGAWEHFNRDYVAQLQRWGLMVDGHVPAARTNVAPEFNPPSEPSLHAFGYTIELDSGRKDFVISGTPEPLGTPGGLPAYWAAIADAIEDRMATLGVTWDDATETQLYATRADHELFASERLARLEDLVRPGLRWFFSRPPIEDLHIEVDVRGLTRESWA